MPSYHDLRTRILKNIVEEVNDFMEHYKSSWTETGCSTMSDGWTDGKQRTLINFPVYCPKGVIFLKSVDASGIRKNADALFSIFDEVVLFVGPEKVVQFITDNDATYKAAGKRLAEKYRTFYWTGCAAHCIDLMLEEMAKPNLFPKNAVMIDTARKVTRFIYNHTRCLYKFGNELRQMFTSNAWSAMSVSSTLVGEVISGIALDNSFWKNVEHIVSVSESLVKVLRLVDSEDKPAMGYLYEAMDKAEKAIQRRLKKKSKFLPYWRVIDRRWETQLHSPLHAAAYFLNPGLYFHYFDPKFDKQREVKRGMNDVVEKMHVHSPKRNRLEHERLNDLVFVHYNLKLCERDMIKKTGKNITNPISLENIDILDEWICEEPNLLTMDDVQSWTCVEQPNQAADNIPDFDFDGGEEEGPGPVTGEELGVEDDDAMEDDDADVAV
ncbi:hypothetical protein CKAN_00143100 [Cinnamomum micranthum f. kanehirae]|uniref:DUF659 domain-containing protein n=1 Tax=Cinnamomum micranthum f. kanehirae TaxID=337451 RepID=A0A3S3MB34_9MAGN|nr:hypothetical protein CKAN_00143100 [Cinnamomum micranthum f. kanehirae]